MGIAEGMGLVGWADELVTALSKARIQEHPVIIRVVGLKESGKYPTDIVVSLTEVEKLVDEPTLNYLLQKCKVVVVY